MATTENLMTTSAPSRAAKWYWSALTIVGILLTITVNGAHAKGVSPEPGTWTAVAVAVMPPAMFAALVEGYFLVRRSVPRGVLRMVTTAVVLLGGAAFAVSYETITMFINRQPGALPMWAGWVMPAMLDTLVAVSTYVLHVLVKHGDEIAVERPRTRSAWTQVRENLENRAIAATAPKPQVDGFTNPGEHVHEPVTNTAVEVHEQPAETFVNPPVEVREPAAKPKPRVREPAAKAVRDDLVPYLPAARVMLTNKSVTRKTETQVAEILKLVDAGKNSYEIRKELGGSTETYDKLTAAWGEWQQDHQDSRQLTAVAV